MTADTIEMGLAQGKHAELTGELATPIHEHPLDEDLQRQHMLPLYRSGQVSDALAAYQHAWGGWVDQLGTEPSKTLRDLQPQMLNRDPH